MYINFTFANSKGVNPNKIIILQAIHQNRTEDLNSFIVENLNVESVSEYITTLKNGEYRLNKQGKDFLDKCQIPNYHENDEAIVDFLLDKFKQNDLLLCSKNKLLSLVSWWRAEVNLSHNEMFEVIDEFLSSKDGEFVRKVDYLFFKPANMYDKPSLDSSRLYAFYENNLEKFNFNI